MKGRSVGKNTKSVSGCGAFELKASYQKNLGLAVLISSAFFFTLALFATSFSNQTTKPPLPPKKLVIKQRIQLGKPPSIIEAEKPSIPVDRSQILAKAKIGLPKPVPEEQAEPGVTIASQDQLILLDNIEVEDVLTRDVDTVILELPPEFPSRRAEFIPYSEAPVAINGHKVPLRYPELALRAGIEGTLYVAALVDKKGNVKDAYIHVESGANAGFEEAALKQAFKLKYRPALNNDIPVKVWIIYKVNFEL